MPFAGGLPSQGAAKQASSAGTACSMHATSSGPSASVIHNCWTPELGEADWCIVRSLHPLPVELPPLLLLERL